MVSLGIALCGSFCTYEEVIPVISGLKERFGKITPIMSEISYATDTRFGSADDIRSAVELACGERVLSTIPEVEPIGPKSLFDALIVAPCTGNTLAKLAHGIADTSVTMACKSHLRNGRPIIIAVSTNDGLGANAGNIGSLLARKHIYFVPFYQNDPAERPNSLVADMELLPETVSLALKNEQLQPMLLQK